MGSFCCRWNQRYIVQLSCNSDSREPRCIRSYLFFLTDWWRISFSQEKVNIFSFTFLFSSSFLPHLSFILLIIHFLFFPHLFFLLILHLTNKMHTSQSLRLCSPASVVPPWEHATRNQYTLATVSSQFIIFSLCTT